jgi:hypothetical protein
MDLDEMPEKEFKIRILKGQWFTREHRRTIE